MEKIEIFFKLVLCLLISGGFSPGSKEKTDLEEISLSFEKSKQSVFPGNEFNLDFRLVEVGETITFTFSELTPGDKLEIFPRYLENCDPMLARNSKAPLQWLDSLKSEILPMETKIQYIPKMAGNYLARWTSKRYGVEYRYFAAIDQTYLIYRPAIWNWPAPFPISEVQGMHNTGLPFDWEIGSDKTDESYVMRLTDEQQRFGGGIVYGMAEFCNDTASSENVEALQNTIDKFRKLGLDIGRVANVYFGGGLSTIKVWTARKAGFDVIDGYVPRGDGYGMGAPYYPFYIGPVDYRFPGQNSPTDAISFIYDFVGSWHFHGPVGFHRPSSNGSWEYARFYIDLAAREAVLNAKNSQVHNLITTLVNYESPVAWGSGLYQVIWDDERGVEFFNNYLNFLAFEQPQNMPIVFARAVDYANYFRAHYREMPRRIISSITHNLEYDKYWTDEWHEQRVKPSGYVPVNQSLKSFLQERVIPKYNMPMSLEFINYNDNRRTCRFEYACPKPVHYYDLTGTDPWLPQPQEIKLPDPEIKISTFRSNDSYEVTYTLNSDAGFPDYLIVIWDIPREYHGCRLETNASEFIWVENTDGNYRGIVRFDLTKSCKVKVKWSHA